MDYRELEGSREFVGRLEHGRQWRTQVEELAAAEGIDAGFYIGLGAVQDAKLYFYDQDEQEYYPVSFDEPFEVASCTGNVSWLEGERFAHTHVVLSREDGSTVAGHLQEATVFAGEVYLREFDARLEREHDPVTDLDLWPF